MTPTGKTSSFGPSAKPSWTTSRLPCEATVIGEAVKVMKFDYDGNNRRGLTAMCRRADGTNYVVAASDLVIPLSASGGRYLAAYRKWMGLAPLPRGTRGRTVQETAVASPDLDGPIELVVLSVKQKSGRCRLLGGDQTFTFRTGRLCRTWCPERSRSYGPRSSGTMRVIPISPA